MYLEHFCKMRALEAAHIDTNQDALDYLLKRDSQSAEVVGALLSKRLQFDTVPEIYELVEKKCRLLNCSKRQFLEMAVLYAVSRADAVYRSTYEEAAGRPPGEPVDDESETTQAETKGA